MKIKQEEYVGKKKKYSEIEYKIPNFGIPSKEVQARAKDTVRLLLDNGYAIMNGYTINEVLKTMRVLKELGIEYTVNVIITKNGMEQTYYEFTTPMFEDDRFVKESDVAEIAKAVVDEIKKKDKNDNSRIYINNKNDKLYVEPDSVFIVGREVTFRIKK